MSILLLVCLLAGCHEQERPQFVAPIWRVGSAQRFDLDLRSKYGAAGTPAVFEFSLVGRMTLEPAQQQGDAIDFVLEMDPLTLSAKRSGAEADVERGAQQLARPAIFRLSKGQLADVWIEPGADPMVTNIVRTIASALQHVPGDGQRWRTIERDATGSYDVEYRVVSPRHVQHAKLGYQRWHASNTKTSIQLAAKLQLPAVAKSTLDVTLDDGGETTELALTEELTMSFGMRSVTQMKLTRVGSGAGATSAAKLTELRARLQHFGADDPATPETISSHKDIASAMDQAKAATVPFDELVSKLEAQTRTHGAALADAGQLSSDESEREELSSDEAAAFAVLSATLRAQPDTIAKVEQLITSGSPAAPRLISGLGAAGTSKAHEVLLRLLNDKTLSEKLRTRCGVALLRTPTPSPAAVSGVAAKLDDPDWHRLAVYGIGSYSRRLREAGDVQEARRLASVLTDRLVHADSPSERADLLRGLSNAGAPEAFDAIRPHIDSPNAEVRAGALTALRLIDRADVDVILAAALSSDVQPSVRLAALRAIADRAASPALSEAVASALMRDASTRIRFESVDLAIKWMPTSPKLREAVRHAAADDAEPIIRQRAAAVDGTKTAAP